jgi:hypothetical protein
VGVKILLYPDRRFEISYQRQVLTYGEQLKNDTYERGSVLLIMRQLCLGGDCGKGQGDFLKNHSCKAYMERLEAVKEQLQARRLQEFYMRQTRRSVNSLQQVPVSLLMEHL